MSRLTSRIKNMKFNLTLKGWRTVMANIFLAILPIAENIYSSDFLPGRWESRYTIFVLAANIILRNITKTPPGWKQ